MFCNCQEEMISNKFIKTEQPIIRFYYEDIITYIKKQKTVFNLQNNSKLIYDQIIHPYYRTIYLESISNTKPMEATMEKYMLFTQLARK